MVLAYCELCDCHFPDSPEYHNIHNIGKKHRRNLAASGTSNPVTQSTQRSSPPPSNPRSQPMSPPLISPPAISRPFATTSDPRLTVSHDRGLDFEVEGSEVAGQPSFPSVDLAIRIEKTEVKSSLSISTVEYRPAPGTPESWCADSIARV